MQFENHQPLVYTVSEACAVARKSRSALYIAIARGELRARKHGRSTRILADDLRAWIDSWRVIAPHRDGEVA